jgi:putative ABC transport system ATP-binding protein
MSALVEIAEVTCRYVGAETAIRMPSLTIGRGEHTLLLGPSGSGKTTLINCMAGLQTPASGQIKLNGVDLVPLAARERDRQRAANIGLVMQRLHLISAMTVRANLTLAQTLAGKPIDLALIAHLTSELNIANKLDAYPRQLSQGEAQRAAIARALVNKPALLLADEPTSALDDMNCNAAIGLLLAQAKNHGATLVVATHDARIKHLFNHVIDLGTL